ncbi:hypothetical protein FH972_017523 [Carpinus fangiana]|uniref:Uncharacterized protein n=1 Tax=Carpinus fangiana TaxID=176857 RepID=A0A5N6RJN8_9ROSI|nr:hypothetical protein FH972_017523 [Carpinus fangiana]
MAYHDDKNDKHEESSPLLGNQLGEEDAKKAGKPTDAKSEGTVEKAPAQVPVNNFGGCGWLADGLPLGHGSVVGEMGEMGRTHWDSSLFDCFGSCDDRDEFCCSDLEVCLLGSVVPCVLYGSNAERLESTPGTFASHCFSYAALFLVGKLVFRSNCLAPWLSYTSRTAIRRKAAVRPFIGHVGAAEAFWQMRRSVNNVRLDVTLQLTSAATIVLFVRKAESSVVGCRIPGSTLNQPWL